MSCDICQEKLNRSGCSWCRYMSHIGLEKMPFGKHKGMKLSDMIYQRTSYVEWMIENLQDSKIVTHLKALLKHKERKIAYEEKCKRASASLRMAANE